MLSQSVQSARLKPYSSLLLYIVPEFQHVDPACELCLHYHPYLVTMYATLLFHLVPKSKHGEPVCEVYVR